MRRWMLLLAACGNDHGIEPDAAGPPGSPTVTIASPRANDAFYMTQSATVTWTATNDDGGVTCDVAATGPATVTIATGKAASSGTPAMATWPLASVAAGTYRVSVTCRDAGGLTGTAMSGMFAVSGPPQQVSFASQIQPMFTASCTSNQCHDATAPQQGLDLVAGKAYTALVGVTSSQCASQQLVKPGDPANSYIVEKLVGGGTCFTGTRMPKADIAWPPEQIQLLRDWIANGAPNN